MKEIRVDQKVMRKKAVYKVQTLGLSQERASENNIIQMTQVSLKNKKFPICFNLKPSLRNLLNRII